jgi:GH18 family chitinase
METFANINKEEVSDDEDNEDDSNDQNIELRKKNLEQLIQRKWKKHLHNLISNIKTKFPNVDSCIIMGGGGRNLYFKELITKNFKKVWNDNINSL